MVLSNNIHSGSYQKFQNPVTVTSCHNFSFSYVRSVRRSKRYVFVKGASRAAQDAPLLVQYFLESEDKGFMKFYLAPKIDE